MTLDRYLKNRRYWEIGLFAALLLIGLFANLGVEVFDRGRDNGGYVFREPFILEASSHFAIALCLPLIIWFNKHFPIRAATWLFSVFAHAMFTFFFSFLHVFIMYWVRVFVFSFGADARVYRWDNWVGEFAYEYLKDFRTYLLIIALLYLYGFILRRLQGEAGFITGDAESDPAEPLSDRFLVKKLGREFLVRVDEIDWVESCGNYVNLHVGDRVYPLRETMTRIDERLMPMGFQRVHRSAIVNLDKVAEIVAFDSGDGQAKLRTDAMVPVSRRFRRELRERLA